MDPASLQVAVDHLALQVVNDYLLDKNLGQALFVGFLLTMLVVVPMGSRKVLSLAVGLFGVIFVLTPISASAIHWRLLGFALVVVAPLLYLTARD